MRKLVHYAASCDGIESIEASCINWCRCEGEKIETDLLHICMHASMESQANAEYLLKEAKIDSQYKTKEGMMGVHWAAQNGHLNVLKMLAKNEVKLTDKGGKAKMTPLHFAAAYGHLDCVEFLLDNKGKVLAKDKFRRTPLAMAVRNGNLKIASLLLSL